MLIDTHAHVNFNAYKDDADEVIRRSLDNEVWLINVGSQYNTSQRAVEIAEKYEKGIYAAVGLHPIHLASGIFKAKIDPAELPSGTHGASTEEIEFKTSEEEFDYEKYKALALRPVRQSFSVGGSLGEEGKVVAIGEIGLDYYYKPKTTTKLATFKEKQKEVFLKQLDLAKELNLPVIFHCRFAHNDLINILTLHASRFKLQGVIHCFTGTQEQAEKYLEMGFYLGFNGIIFSSFAKSYGGSAEASGEGGKLNCDEVIQKTPLEKILVETDCPYLTPLPMTGRNEPLYVKYVAEKIAKIKNISYEEITEITTQNAKKLFKL